jgi:hypothetical protein
VRVCPREARAVHRLRHLRDHLPPLNAIEPRDPAPSPIPADEIVRVDFRYGRRELLLGAWEFHLTRVWPIAVGAFCVVAALLGVALVPDLAWLYVLLGALGIFLASGVSPVLVALVRLLRSHPERNEMHLEVGPLGLAYAEKDASSNVGWAYFPKARQTRHFLVIVFPGGNGFLLPLRLFSSDQLSRIKRWIAPLLARS